MIVIVRKPTSPTEITQSDLYVSWICVKFIRELFSLIEIQNTRHAMLTSILKLLKLRNLVR